MATSNEIRGQRLYGGTPAPKVTAPAQPARRSLYADADGLTDQPFASAYGPRLFGARLKDDHMEVARLEAEQRELKTLSGQLKLKDAQVLRVANAMRDTANKPLTHTELPESDRLRLSQRFGEHAGKVIEHSAAHVNELLKDKPTLLDAVVRGGSWMHRDVIETVAEAGLALGVVPSAESK